MTLISESSTEKECHGVPQHTGQGKARAQTFTLSLAQQRRPLNWRSFAHTLAHPHPLSPPPHLLPDSPYPQPARSHSIVCFGSFLLSVWACVRKVMHVSYALYLWVRGYSYILYRRTCCVCVCGHDICFISFHGKWEKILKIKTSWYPSKEIRPAQ